MSKSSSIFSKFLENKQYSDASVACVEEAVHKLLNSKTNATHPGMLLGKIQSGKTRTFIGIIALAFDTVFDICVVFTKGTKALAEQTYKRLEDDFRDFNDNDIVKIYDIMNIPTQLTPYIRRQKLIIVVKKQTHNLDRLIKFFNSYPDLAAKRTLFIDDEADIASIGFRRDQAQQDGVSMNVLASKISHIRAGFTSNYSFLQVTATPYSLYLQPKGEIQLNDAIFEPVRPAFTTLVPMFESYVGGKEYFELSENPNSVFSHLHIQVPDLEMSVLQRRDQRYLTNILTTPNLHVFRQSIVNYLVAGAIRMIQCNQENRNYKSSFIVHTSPGRQKHQWQVELTEKLMVTLQELASKNDPLLENLIRAGYDNMFPSIKKSQDSLPTFTDVFNMVKETLSHGMIGIIKINSENQILALLDRKGQLRLDNPFNIFIGGQILDRGLTIENLIGFFYGRNPNVFQQDTVLQHSRMYGARSKSDIAVTRLYTSNRIYRALNAMHDFDAALREAFERGVHNEDDGVIFIESDASGIIRPCAPSKILITATQTIRPLRRFLPVGFQTKARTSIQKIIDRIDIIVNQASQNNSTKPFVIDVEAAIEIINLIESTFEYGQRWNNLGYEWDKGSFIAIVRRLVDGVRDPELQKKLYCYAPTGRKVSRLKNNNTAFTDAPDDGQVDMPIAKRVAIEMPCLMLLKQEGLLEKGWRDCEFWWPVLLTPSNARTAIFASETIN